MVTATMSKTSVDVGTNGGTVLGTVAVQVKEADATLVSVSTNNSLFNVVNNNLVLTRMPTKADAKSHSVVITATDSSGMTGTSTVTVTVNKTSSGTFGWFSLLALPLLLLRRKRD
ncbi:GlyGly-CTERM sorting domain-containing protein [Rheinheimera sp. MMS21-TC3]|uniref:GlyGly-CTERM sorting domain-containing protein n=1 Tax=Rheinheimera sp. MMS21-TC3 TaxID=3072790 RepID=UPI0028C44B63|nr:GlyGly-CTERM sorting domain-containing protein [Rheinheimera sp. MMS21-TC3]WNO60078.1 GlyGly-CTERM sorting domain-containing protein [Rheinheimera sp. MMS21-TC3]